VSRLHTTGLASGAKGSISSFDLPSSAGDQMEEGGEGRTVHSITHDTNGRIWFGTDIGVYVYSPTVPKPIVLLRTQEGLCGENVLDILEDKKGRMWFATKSDGVCYVEAGYEPGQAVMPITHLETKAGHKGTEVADIFEDTAGSIWFTVNGVGTYRFEGDSLYTYFEEQSCVSHTFNTTFQDNLGRIWFGGWLGLFRYHDPC
jgi:ligand-binding sensor domain-containing protein